MRTIVPKLIFVLLLALPCLLLFPRIGNPPTPSASGFDQLQASRYLVTRKRLGTQNIRPLETAPLTTAYGDGAIPDFAHAPLYTALSGVAMQALRETKPGLGQRASALLGMGLLLTAALLTTALSRRCFPERSVLRAPLLWLWGGGVIAYALIPSAGLLVAALGALLFSALLSLDVQARSKRAPLLAALVAGALWGVLWLSLYSALLLLPVLVWHVVRVSQRSPRIVLGFLAAALLVSAPQLYRSYKFAHNPLYHARLSELVMHTESFPGTTLYQTTHPARSVGVFLVGGGATEVSVKAARTLSVLFGKTFGLFGLPLVLFLASGLVRFTDDRVNRLRNLVFVAFPVHALGLALFVPADEAVGALLLYSPLVAVVGSAFLETVIRARRLPRLHAQVLLIGYSVASVLPGVWTVLSQRPGTPPASVYELPYDSTQRVERIQDTADAVIAASEPAEAAFLLDVPVLMLPASQRDLAETTEFIHKPLVGAILTPSMRWDRADDPISRVWGDYYRHIIALMLATERLKGDEREETRAALGIAYPPDFEALLRGFRAYPVSEPRWGGEYSLLIWSSEYRPL